MAVGEGNGGEKHVVTREKASMKLNFLPCESKNIIIIINNNKALYVPNIVLSCEGSLARIRNHVILNCMLPNVLRIHKREYLLCSQTVSRPCTQTRTNLTHDLQQLSREPTPSLQEK